MRVARLAAFIAWSVLAVLLGLAPAAAEKRVALIVGNGAYQHVGRLPNPRNDAELMAETLRSLGFTLIGDRALVDLDKHGFDNAVQSFGAQLQGADVGLFYYAGHGMQLRGTNYLVPVGANPTKEADVDFQMLDANLVLRQMEGSGTKLNVVILDACRNNPFIGRGLRATARGLAQMQAPEGTLISYATQPGNVALDGTGGNSPYTKALAQTMRRAGLDIFQTFNEVGLAVKTATGGSQQPWVSSSPIAGTFYFSGAPAVQNSGPIPPQPDPARFEIIFWESIKNEKNSQLFEAYLKRYPAGAFADIAKINLQQQKIAAMQSTIDQPGDKIALSDPGLLREVRERLYELNYDPGAFEGPISETDRQVIREFEQSSKLATTGEATQGLLRRLREISGLKPWGAIVYDKKSEKWGMAWSQETRKAAIASARKSCGDPSSCSVEISFFGTECGVFAHSGSNWSIVARDDIQKAKDTAMSDCRKLGKACYIVASVCANGAERYQTAN
jgi:uncharacterized caspase-like protein